MLPAAQQEIVKEGNGQDEGKGAEFKNTLSYKQKQQAEQKKSAENGHNWNSLFLGSNAVADAMCVPVH